MKRIFVLLILLISIYIPAISQIDEISNLVVNKHYFPILSDTLSISATIKADKKSISNLRCRAIFSSATYKIGEDYIQDRFEVELTKSTKLSQSSMQFGLNMPINIFKKGRYSIKIEATVDNWQNTTAYNAEENDIAPITIGKFGMIAAYSDLSVASDTSKFAFLAFDNNLDLTSNKLEGIYTQGFCNNELVSFNGFNMLLWKDKSISDISISIFYSIDKGDEIEFSNAKINDNSIDGTLLYNNTEYKYPFYSNEKIEDISISINQKIYDIINHLDLSDDELHTLNFSFVIKADNKTIIFPSDGKLNYRFKAYDLPTGADCQAALLPIDLLKWEAHKKEKIVYLDWTTVSEVNNSSFEIQKSNNSTNWKTIETIKGNGTTNNINNYSAIDKFPYPGQNYYRLRQSDFDGNFKYSKVKSIFIFDNKINLFPNPASDYIYYTISDYTKEFKIEIFDNQGRLIENLKLPLKNNNKNRIDITQLKKGTYFLKYINLENHIVQIHTFIRI